MLRWCSHCQQFLGEIAPHSDFSLTHGLCRDCSGNAPGLLSGEDLEHAVFLREIFHALFAAGRRRDLEAAAPIVERAVAAKCRPVDILVGMIAPMLYKIGDAWERGTLTVDDEHEFTAFSERVIDLLEDRIRRQRALSSEPGANGRYLLMSAPGNTHVVGLRILELWLQQKGARTRAVDDATLFDVLAEPAVGGRPNTLLISIALPEQRDGVAALAARVQALPKARRPRIVLGGYAVKVGLVPPIAGVDFASDISALGLN